MINYNRDRDNNGHSIDGPTFGAAVNAQDSSVVW